MDGLKLRRISEYSSRNKFLNYLYERHVHVLNYDLYSLSVRYPTHFAAWRAAHLLSTGIDPVDGEGGR
jgi:hypothetical protein